MGRFHAHARSAGEMYVSNGCNWLLPSGLEPRILTRWDMHKYAREAYNAGIRFIGGCCGFEPYHIRALAEELSPERGSLPAGSEKHGSWGAGLEMHTKPWVRARSEGAPAQNDATSTAISALK